MIRIFTNSKEKDLKNFWNHIVFHPTDAIEDDWGKRILDKCAEDGAVKTVRIYTMFEDIFTLDENGNIKCDFELNDYRIDYLTSKGFNLLIAFTFLPEWLCANLNSENKYSRDGKRYKGKTLYNTFPNDYSKWQELCRLYTEHLVKRYGEDTVAGWRFSCYNEPDHPGFFYNDAPNMEARLAEYVKLYDGFEAGVTSVSHKIPIGGPALAESNENFEFFRLFLEHVKKNNRKLDFLSIHSYGTGPQGINTGLKPLDVNGAVHNTMTLVRIAKMCGFENIPIVCDEWGAATCGFYNIQECPGLMFRENEIYSAYFAKMIASFDEMNIPYDEMMICLSGQHEMTTDFSGYRNFFTLNFYPKPIYNAFVLAAKLGNEKLNFVVNNSHDHISVIPTRHPDGHISALLAYADNRFIIDLPEIEVPIKFMGIDKKYNVKKYVIDKDHANAITKYNELGCPDNPTDEQKEIIRAFGTLKCEDAETVSPDNDTLTLKMINNAVVLLELFPAE